MCNVPDIQHGIAEEILATRKHVDYRIEDRQQTGALWVVTVKAVNQGGQNELDESLEGAAVWWAGHPPGTGDVLSVLPDESKIVIRYATQPPPAVGELIRVYLPQYLEALQNIWSGDIWPDQCVEWLENLEIENPTDAERELSPATFPWLRKAQRKAFKKLTGRALSFLHGPPGTGKTRTLGALVAEYLLQFPNDRVLLLSTTNVAVDEAIISVDTALEEIPATQNIRLTKVKRLGNHFVATKYADRTHLLPTIDEDQEEIVQELVRLEALRPPEHEIHEYAAWRAKVDHLRAELRQRSLEIFNSSRLIAMTTTRAVFTFETIRANYNLDLIVFDESSQVGIAHALALAPLGNRCLFAGDPQQLAPICRSDVEDAQNYLGKSMFSRRENFEDSMVFLNEQSRMTTKICQVVSNTFYQERLKVAENRGPEWEDERDISNSHVQPESVAIKPMNTDGAFNFHAGGPVRNESAAAIAQMVTDLIQTDGMDAHDILVLTPFRSQRKRIRWQIRQHLGRCPVKVSTVHKAQGSECHTVIFDPAAGNMPFLRTEDARRLVNVALSRAKARLTIMLSDGDCQNPLFQVVKAVIQRIDLNGPDLELILAPDFPFNVLGQRLVMPNGRRGVVTEILEDGASFRFIDNAWHEATFVTHFVVNTANNANH